MQPLDVCVYSPIKKLKNYFGRRINQYDIGKLFTPAYLKGATAQNAVKGFQTTGIFPYNPNIFRDEDFAPASLTDRLQEIPANRNSNKPAGYSSDKDIPLLNVVHKNKVPLHPPLASSCPVSSITTASLGQKSDVESTFPSSATPAIVKSNMAFDWPSISVASPSKTLVLHVAPLNSSSESLALTIKSSSVPSTSRVYYNELQKHVSPFDVRPVRKMCLTSSSSRKRKSQKSEILTSSPIKQQQLDKFNSKAVKYKKHAVTKPVSTMSTGQQNKKRVSHRKMSSKLAAITNNSDTNCNCLPCGEPFGDTGDDWIQCSGCKNWSHKLCSSYSGFGPFICDFCSK
ncbi:hypothetical protein QE152_g40795 [Popillia japonica]|uniref:Zinc finger PHD-type domain-containing protein n=1 Tax=Popillia japonica TaxID=7064 RepID=A0AAW1HFB8_POPJA